MSKRLAKSTYGSLNPRVQTTPLSGPSLGPLASQLMDLANEPLLEWQKYILDQGLMINKAGAFRRKTNSLVIARQNGKTHCVRALLLSSLFVFNTKRIGIMAQDRKQSLETMQNMVDTISGNLFLSERLKTHNRSHGEERLEIWCEHFGKGCPPGCNPIRRLDIISATPRAARGKTLDLLYIDELREISPAVWAAAEPTLRARKNSQLWTSSNAGDDSSIVLNTLRDSALTTDSERFGYWEWSAAPELKISDRKGWRQANPSLGHLINEQDLEDSMNRNSPDVFTTESLCRWVAALDSPFNVSAFDNGLDTSLVMDPTLPTWCGLDLTFNRTEAYLVSAQEHPDGLRVFLHRWIKDNAIGERELASDIAVIARQYKVRQIAFDPATAGFVAPHLQRAGIRMQDNSWGSAYFATLCDVTASAMNAERLKHAGQSELRDHIIACARRPASDGGWRIARRASQSPISAAVALVLAVGHAEVPRTQIVVAVG
jgi:phage terminase large subunit-like protein